MKRLFPHPVLTLLLVALWLLMNNTLSIGHLVLGFILGWSIPLICRNFLIDVPRVRKPIKLVFFIIQVFYDIVLANLHIARLVLGPKSKLNPAFVEVPVDIEDEFLLSALASIVSLTPGTVSAGLSHNHKTLLLHGLDIPDEQALIAQVKSRYEAPLMEIFACSHT